ncbi:MULTISPECIES: hypothetical protein [unclassified Endozoicomonas]|uniref:hypothetical protein n=1 Tax=unclassified Endozoicomonas TaxID=2644528 RepID=UPI002148A598|nr:MULTISPECIES: hypothetical protein [unclassified Endozoicomonas]
MYVQGHKILKICVLPEDPRHREIDDSLRYSLMEMKTSQDDDYQEFVDVRFEAESPEEFEQVIFDEPKLKQWLVG